MKKQLFGLVLLIALVASCKNKKDPEPSLPAETATGANTFGCMLNGQL